MATVKTAMRQLALALAVALAGCAVPGGGPPGTDRETRAVGAVPPDVARFRTVAARVEPMAEQLCRSRGTVPDCDFLIGLDTRPGLPANAFQTVDGNGRPILVFTRALLSDLQNPDELAFVMSHEAAHHIAGHIPRQQRNAMRGAIMLGGLASLSGGDRAMIEAAADLGAKIGARQYSKEFELEADAIGTVIAHAAGFDPVRGAAFFRRLPDPGDRVLGTHPPNAQRVDLVRRVAAGL